MGSIKSTVVKVIHENAVVEAGVRHILGPWSEFEVLPPDDSNFGIPRDQERPDMIILDHDSALEWAANRKSDSRDCTNVMVVAMLGQETDVRLALESGVRGYVQIGSSAEELVSAVRAVAAGRRYLCAASSLRMADSMGQPTLTHRESEVLALVFRGCNNKEVARSLDISVGTVKSHMRGLLSKLGAQCRTEALWVASQRGLIKRTSDSGAPKSHLTKKPIRTDGWTVPSVANSLSKQIPKYSVMRSASV